MINFWGIIEMIVVTSLLVAGFNGLFKDLTVGSVSKNTFISLLMAVFSTPIFLMWNVAQQLVVGIPFGIFVVVKIAMWIGELIQRHLNPNPWAKRVFIFVLILAAIAIAFPLNARGDVFYAGSPVIKYTLQAIETTFAAMKSPPVIFGIIPSILQGRGIQSVQVIAPSPTPTLLANNDITEGDCAVVTSAVRLRSEATTRSNELITLRLRARVQVLDVTSDHLWARVEFGNSVGWVAAQYLGFISCDAR